VRPSCLALDLFGADESVSFEANEVLTGGHGGEAERTGGFFDCCAARSLQEDEYLLFAGLHKRGVGFLGRVRTGSG
jgi:hypothetical protein